MSMTSDAFDAALARLQQGQLDEAARGFQAVLAAEPGHAAASHLLGVVFLQRGEVDRAVRQIRFATVLDPNLAIAHYNLGNALAAQGETDAAIASFDRAISLRPGFFEARYNRANTLAQARHDEEALAGYEAALVIKPNFAQAHNNRGNALRRLGRVAEALVAVEQALALEPALADAHNNRGNALRDLGRQAGALASYDRALALQPNLADAWSNRGLALEDAGRFDEALASFERAIALQPTYAGAHSHRGDVLRRLQRFDEALASCDQAVALQPGFAGAYNTRGIVFHERQRYERALADYDRAIALDAGFADAHNNRGNALHDLNRLDEALQAFETAIALRPGFAEAINNRGMVRQDLRLLTAARSDYDQALALRPDYPEAFKRRATLHLLQSDYDAGWRDYEASAPACQAAAAPGVPVWQGEPLAGKSILLSEPNGLGDTLQFLRYIPLLLAQGASVAFLGPRTVFRLLAPALPQVRFLEALGPGDRFDYQRTLWGLPFVFASRIDTIPGGVPYVFPEAERVRTWSRLLEPAAINIGISWQGNPARKIDVSRSIPLAEFAPVAQVPGVRLISLQKHAGLEQLARLPAGMVVHTPPEGFDDGPDAFVDTAALMMGLDLVIACDTSANHLAGALGRPAWAALKFVPEWRWGLDRSDSPWYPSLRLFRQAAPGDWHSVFTAMAAALHADGPALRARRTGPA